MNTKILLDTNVFINFPELLSFSKKDVELIVLNSTINEIKALSLKRKQYSNLSDLVDAAINEKNLLVEKFLDSPAFSKGFSPAFSTADSVLISYITNKKLSGEIVKLATDDKSLSNFCQTIGVLTVSSSDLRKVFKENKNVASKLNRIAKNISRKQILSIGASFFIGIVSSLIASFAFNNIHVILLTINIWGTIIALPTIGIFMYYFREHYRLTYGVFETFVGFIIGLSIFYPDFSYSTLDITTVLKIVGGLYVEVRGLDNIGKGSKGTKLEPYWNKLSYG